VNSEITRITTAGIDPATLDEAWKYLDFTWEPLPATLRKGADDAYALGFLGSSKPDITNIYDLTALKNVLAQLGLPAVKE
jgi:NitT/TauT family transport system substrate-binding protein